jgi:pyruvate/2-oxoglutarate dehydrogenase complex dihydrolipoamide acyltransferase (E2) component
MTDVTQVNATPHALRLSARWGVDLKKVRGSGRGERISVADLESAIVAAGGRIASPTPPVRPAKRRARIPMIARYRPPRWRAVWPANWGSTCTTAEAAVHAVG